MVGHPKYSYRDIVTFKINKEIKEGIVFIIDKFGTFMDDSDVFYDLYVKSDKALYKHIKENGIIEKIGKARESDLPV